MPRGECVFSSDSDSLTFDDPLSETSAWRAVVRILRSPVDALCCALFPATCRVCANPLLRFTAAPICDFCWNQLPEQSDNLCERCGEALGGGPVDSLCRACRLASPPFEKAIAHGRYQSTLRALLHLLKYRGMRPLANPLGDLLARKIAALDDLPLDLTFVPVPLFRGKSRQRGFNQAELLTCATARSLHRRRPELGVKIVRGALERQRATEGQAGLTAHQRRRNLRGAFSVPRPELVQGKDILLIDDIYTTGATARACSQALRKAGAASVRVATVARAQRHGMTTPPVAPVNVPMQEDVAFWDMPSRAGAG